MKFTQQIQLELKLAGLDILSDLGVGVCVDLNQIVKILSSKSVDDF